MTNRVVQGYMYNVGLYNIRTTLLEMARQRTN